MMDKMKVIFCALMLFCALSQSVLASKLVILVDSNDIATIADEVCQNDDTFQKQIERISTIKNLANFMETVHSDHKLAACKSKFGESIEALNNVVSSTADLCSPEKIDLLVDYHRDYVSTVSKFKEMRKKSGKAAPKMIKLFFMHYSSYVSTKCSELAVAMIQGASEDVEEREGLKKMLAAMGPLEEDLSSLKGYEDIFLMWNLMASLPSSVSSKMNKYIDHSKKVKVTVEVAQDSGMEKLQEVCRNVAKPFYSIALLPVIRLTDLGYYPETRSILQQLQNDDFARVVYGLTVICENYLPVRFINNQALPEGKLVMVEQDVAESMFGPASEEAAGEQVDTARPNSLSDNIIVPSSEGVYAQSKRIKSQVKSRGKIMKQIIKRIIHSITKSPSSAIGVIVMGEVEEPVVQSASQIKDQDVPEMSEDESELVEIRRRRSIGSILKAPFKFLGIIGIAVLYFLIHWFPHKVMLPAIIYTTMAMHYIFVAPVKWLAKKIG